MPDGEAEHASHWWARRAAAKEADVWAARHADACQRWGDHVSPEADRLDAAIGLHRDELERLNASMERQLTRSAAVTEQRKLAQGMVGGLVARLEQYRYRLDGPTARGGACWHNGPPTAPGRSRLLSAIGITPS